MTQAPQPARRRPLWFEQGLRHLTAFVAAYGVSAVPFEYVSEDGFRLGYWVHNRRKAYIKGALDEQLAAELEALPGWMWRPRSAQLQLEIDDIARYLEAHGRYPTRGTRTRPDLGLVIRRLRVRHRKGELPAATSSALESIPGWSWRPWDDEYENLVAAVRHYISIHGPEIPRAAIVGKVRIGEWAALQRKLFRNGRLSQKRRSQLESIPGWRWASPRNKTWDTDPFWFRPGFEHLLEYVREYGTSAVPFSYVATDGFRLGWWVHNRRKAYAAGALSPHLAARLESLAGWRWSKTRRHRL